MFMRLKSYLAGWKTIIVSVFLFAIWIIALDTYAGVRHVSPSLVDMARSFGASRAQLYGKVLIWAALPEELRMLRDTVARFVKAFNSVGHAQMVNPVFESGPPTMFICGNDAAAKTCSAGLPTISSPICALLPARWSPPASRGTGRRRRRAAAGGSLPPAGRSTRSRGGWAG